MRKLTYTHGRFVLDGVTARENYALTENSQWEDDETGEGQYATVNLKAALAFREIADERAEKILNKAFVKFFPPPQALPSFLDPHQCDGVRWILTRSRSYLNHAPGAGKTAQAIVAAFLSKGWGQAVFIVPPTLTVNWAREVMKFLDLLTGEDDWPSMSIVPESRYQEFTGWRAEYLIVPDSLLTRPWVLENLKKTPIRFLAVDEASRMKDEGAERSKALYGGRLKSGEEVSGLIYQAEHVVLMDGSPMPNRPMELWAPTYAMSPQTIDFMSKEEFGFRYCGAKINDFGRWEFKHASHLDELKDRLSKTFMHVVPESVLKHPERRRAMIFLNEDVRSNEQKTWERKHLASILKKDTMGEDDSQGDLARFRRELGLRKIPLAAKYIRDRLAEKGEFLLVFAWHREVVERLAQELKKWNPGVVLGGTSKEYREKVFREFQGRTRRLLIGNILSMGRGHNLQNADRGVFVEFSWTDENNKQCEKRSSRRGSTKEFFRSDYLVVPNSMDEKVLSAVFTKAGRVKRMFGE